ncbi:MAG: MATE family efflux transporter [Pseudomonadota bacterium]
MLRKEIHALFELAWPIVLVQIGIISLGVVDTISSGYLGPDATAAVGLAQAWRIAALIIAQGVAAGMVPLIAYAWTQNNVKDIAQTFKHSVMLFTILAIPIACWYYWAEKGLYLLGQPVSLIHETGQYCRILILSIPGFLGFYLLQSLLQGTGRIKPIICVILLTNIINALANGALMFGWAGLPALGIMGIAWSTVIISYSMFAALFVLAYPLLKKLPIIHFAISQLAKITQKTLPVGLQWALEIGVFQSVLLLAGQLDKDTLAAHVIIQNLSSVVFIMPLGLSIAIAIRVAHLCATKQSWIPAAKIAVILSGVIVLLPAILFITIPLPLGMTYTHSPSVLKLIAITLPIVGVMQLFDAIQVTVLSILRGLGDVATPSLIHPLGLWCIGLPLSAIFASHLGLGLAGLWGGLTIGVMSVAVILTLRLIQRSRFLLKNKRI